MAHLRSCCAHGGGGGGGGGGASGALGCTLGRWRDESQVGLLRLRPETWRYRRLFVAVPSNDSEVVTYAIWCG